MKPSWYFLKNSQGEYDGLWTLAIFSFILITIVSFLALVSWIALWSVYYSIISGVDKDIAKIIKTPGIKFSDISTWVGSFGGLVLGPVIAGYVARRNQIFVPQEQQVPPQLVSHDDDGH